MQLTTNYSIQNQLHYLLNSEVKMDENIKCFIIMPFSYLTYKNSAGKNINLKKKQLDFLYDNFIKKAAESFKRNKIKIEAKRYESGSGNFMKGIVNKLFTADLVIAEITGLNPNVMYELGIRHTLKNNTIMIAQDKSQIPSDLLHYIAILYKYPKKLSDYNNFYNIFEAELHKAIQERIEKCNESDNPVRDFIQIKKKFENENRIDINENNYKQKIEAFNEINTFSIDVQPRKHFPDMDYGDYLDHIANEFESSENKIIDILKKHTLILSNKIICYLNKLRLISSDGKFLIEDRHATAEGERQVKEFVKVLKKTIKIFKDEIKNNE
ncbi:TPA: hypothetical protein DEG21_02860 [Patescibacteria group bacterium]|nr:hypothetical protein [Candidatus Gracilibacteria bacterium]